MLTLLLLQSALLTNSVSEGSIEPSTPASDAAILDLDILNTPEQGGDESPWSGKAAVSLTDVSGNSESSNGAADLTFGWEGDLDAFNVGAHYAGVRTSGTTTSRLYAYDAAYNRFFSEEKNLYGYANAGTRQDEPNGLQMRASTGVGLGYRFHYSEGSQLDVEGGASFVAENKIGTVNETSGVGRAAFDYLRNFWEDYSFTADGEYLNGGDIETYVQNVGLSWHFGESWDLTLSNSIAWDGNPSAGFSSTDRRWNLFVGTTF